MTFSISKGGVSIKWNGPQQLMSVFTDLLFACYGMLSQLTSTIHHTMLVHSIFQSENIAK